MPTIIIKTEIEIWCSCGKGLCEQSVGGEGFIQIDPCENCLEKAKDEGYEQGFAAGKEVGFDDGGV